MILLELFFSLHTCTHKLEENMIRHIGPYLVQGNSGIFAHANINNSFFQMIPVTILSDKMRSGVLLAMYIILSVLHRNTLYGMQQCESQQL